MRTPIAIVGRGCVLPGGLDPDTFAARILAGEDLVSEVPDDRWRVPRSRVLVGPDGDTRDRAHHARGGYVTGFDASFRVDGLRDPASILASADPTTRWLCHAARDALDEAGVVDRARVGAVVGNLSFPSEGMARAAADVWTRGADPGMRAALGLDRAVPSDRFFSARPAAMMARAVGLGQRVLTLDAACASALYAIGVACDWLASGTCDAVLAGAVNRSDDLFLHVGFTALQALSPTGRSRPFHAGADGLVPAEGCALFVLKRLSDAVRDGDAVFGVIRGVGLANDGRPGGILAPSAEGQARAIRAAWDGSGCDPRHLGLLECHATGTPVGDRTELESTAAALDGLSDVPIGSIKSNLGHPVTAAGGAALIKVLGAMQAGVRPPTLHVDDPNPALAGGPFRVLHAAEPWDGAKLAAVSAFGFGGNDAHLVVTDDPSDAGPVAPLPAAQPMAVLGVGARGAAFRDAADLVVALAEGRAVVRAGEARLDHVEVALTELRFPPKDLDHTLAQQLLVMEAAREALGRAGDGIDPHRTGIFVGMEADAEVARYGLRWRLAASLSGEDLTTAREAVVPVLTSAGVVGTMPNIPANRCSNRFDLRGPGFVVSSGARSGLDALALAVDALAAGRIDHAVVAAVDLSCEPVHRAASEDGVPPGDHAVAFVLGRSSDDAVATVSLGDAGGEAVRLGAGGLDLSAGWGRAYAADGLVHLVAAIASVATDRGPAEGVRRAVVSAEGPEGLPLTATVAAAGPPVSWSAWSDAGPTRRVPAHPPSVSPDALSAEAPMAQVSADRSPAPVLPPILDEPMRPPVAPGPEAIPASPPVQAAVPALSPPVPAAVPQVAPAPAPAPALVPTVSGVSGALAHVTAAHQRYLQHQNALQQQFLAMRQAALSAMTPGQRPVVAAALAPSTPASAPSAPAPVPVVAPPGVTPPASMAPASPAPRPTPQPAVSSARPAPAPRPSAAPARPSSAVAPSSAGAKTWDGTRVTPPSAGVVVTAPPTRVPVRAADLPGPTLDRAALTVHASGPISTIYGPTFADQDGYARQCRMPEPPLLLADRVVGIDAPDHVLGTGTLWSETDVGSQDWYLHQGRIPAGVMIEAGQADLMLISWMGIDRFCASERVYRLLGCTLTYHDTLPQVGDTLQYDIHVDGHAKDGDIRLFFFHYDCVDQHGNPRLSVRGGQAGFFTDEELADSDGVLWSAETGDHDPSARLDAPAVVCTKTAFDAQDLIAFAAGDAAACFGPGFESLRTHNDTPRIDGGRMRFLHRVTHCAPDTGPWGRGYLRAEWDVSPDDWFFEGHFHNDPCMPGTLMFEGCLQALAVYLASLGYTIGRDGWRFEPVPGNPIPMICRGQVLPDDAELVYEVFVEEVHDGPTPTVYADLLCTIDGLKAFHARRCGLRLAPAWPLDHLRTRLMGEGPVDPEPVAEVDGFRFGLDSLIACAWGRPSEAFGPMYAPFDGPRCVPRLPGPPYHFLSRVLELDGPIGGMKVGTRVQVAWDIDPGAWWFDQNGAEVMPFAVLLEAALQPCGWLASYVGSALTTDEDLFFRNLDGTATLHQEPVRTSGTLITDVTITNISQSGGMIIQSFEVTCRFRHEDAPVYTMKTVFGFFPAKALATQKGLPFDAALRDEVMHEGTPVVDLTRRPAAYFEGSLRLPQGDLCMIDRITRYDVSGGSEGLGRVITAKDVTPGEWFFKAHFFQDPVQPGSLGLEAMIQALQWWMIASDRGAGMAAPRFEPLALGDEHGWTYRGQVTPSRERIACDVEILEVRTEPDGSVVAIATGSLWCDGLRIYAMKRFGMRVVDGAAQGSTRHESVAPWRLDPAVDTWVGDHRPTWTVPSLPMMSLVDRAVAVARASRPDAVVVGIPRAEVLGWVVVDEPVTLSSEVVPSDEGLVVTLSSAVDDGAAKPVFRAALTLAEALPAAPRGPGPFVGEDMGNPYAEGRLFHGPAFQALRHGVVGEGTASAWLDVGRVTVPPGALGQGLLDATLHAIPHDGMADWAPGSGIPDGVACYPRRLRDVRLYVLALPFSGTVRVHARFLGIREGAPSTEVVVVGDGGEILLAYVLDHVMVPRGPIGDADPADRVAFLRDHVAVPGVGLGRPDGDATLVRDLDVRASDWLPGTLEAAYGLSGSGDRLDALACRDHAARVLGVHPSTLVQADDRLSSPVFPLNPVKASVARVEGGRRVTGSAPLDLTSVEAWWRDWFGTEAWPLEDLDYAVIERFVRRVGIVDPAGMDRVRGRPALFLANHQTAVESLLFSILAGALTEVPCVTIAKAEHRTTWLGRFIAHGFSYPAIRDPRVITFFDREDKASLQALIADLAGEMAAGTRSGMVHVEGTRAFHARHPTVKLSGAFVDMALEVGVPIVPVRFVGGLPVAPLDVRTEFPVGYGRQDVWFGTPLWPDDLRSLGYRERKQAVLDGIHAAGPPLAEEVPLPGDPALAEAVEDRVARTGVEVEHAVLAEVLAASSRRTAAGTAHLVAAIEQGVPVPGEGAEADWLRELARRLAGEG